MRVSSLRLVPCSKLSNFTQSHLFSALPQLIHTPIYDEQIVHTQYKKITSTIVNGAHFFELDRVYVIREFNKLKIDPIFAISYFHRIKERGFQPDVRVYLVIIRMICNWGLDRELLHSMFVAVVETKPRSSLFRDFDAFVRVYTTPGTYNEISTRHGVVAHVLSCHFRVNRLIEHGKYDMFVAIYRHLKGLGLIPNDYTYGLVIKTLCRMGNLEEAFSEFQEMKDADVPLISLFAYTAVIRLCNEKMLKSAEVILCDMEKRGITPNTYIYMLIICSYCKTGNLCDMQKALSHHDNMVSRGIQTNNMIVSSLLQCLCKKGLASVTVGLFHEFKNSNVFLDEFCYNIVMDAMCEMGEVEEAMKLLNDMKSKHMVLDIVHYTTLIRLYCLQGNVYDTLRLFKELNEKGIEPDKITYNVLHRGLCKCGKLHIAIELLDYTRAQGFEPNSTMYNMVIEGLCIEGKVEEAEFFSINYQQRILIMFLA